MARLRRVRSVVRGAAAVAALALGVSAWAPYAARRSLRSRSTSAASRSTAARTRRGRRALERRAVDHDRLGPQPQPQYFTYDRQIQDSTVHIGVVGAPQTADSDGV